MALTAKQKSWAEHLVSDADFNATLASRLAKYKGDDNAMAVQGHHNLRNPKIMAYAQELLDEAGMGKEEVKARIATYARGVDISQFYEIVEREVVTTYKNGSESSEVKLILVPDLEAIKKAGVGHHIKGIKQFGDSMIIEWKDDLKMLSEAAKLHGLGRDEDEDGGNNITFIMGYPINQWEKEREHKKKQSQKDE